MLSEFFYGPWLLRKFKSSKHWMKKKNVHSSGIYWTQDSREHYSNKIVVPLNVLLWWNLEVEGQSYCSWWATPKHVWTLDSFCRIIISLFSLKEFHGKFWSICNILIWPLVITISDQSKSYPKIMQLTLK